MHPGIEPHDCLEHLEPKECTSVEPHGEKHTDLWYECSWCGAEYTEKEAFRESVENSLYSGEYGSNE